MIHDYLAKAIAFLPLYCYCGMSYPTDKVFPMGLGSLKLERLIFPLFKHRPRPASMYLLGAAILDYILIGGVFAVLPRFLSIPDRLSALVYAILTAEVAATLCAVSAWYAFRLPGSSRLEKIGLRVGGVLMAAMTVAAVLYPFFV